MTDAGQAWVTLATNDSYALGSIVLANSLRRVNTSKQLVVMITPGISGPMRGVLSDIFNEVVEVNVLDSEDAANLALLTRPELGITFTKLHCWRLVQYEKCVFLDADTLVLQNCDELFNRDEFSAAPDSGWPDCFNSGVFVYKPSMDTYAKLLQFAVEKGSFDGGDQGLLNLYFSDWSTADISKHLPFIYNMVATATYSYLPAYKVFGQNVKIAHFIGPVKPWVLFFDSSTGQVRPEPGQEHLQDLLQAWWDIFRADVHPKLSPDMKGLAGVYAKISFYGNKSWEQIQAEDAMRKSAWEQGNIDYLGRDSFDNIMARIQASMAEVAVTKRAKSPSPAKQPKQRTPPPAAPEVPSEPQAATTADAPVSQSPTETPATQSEAAPAPTAQDPEVPAATTPVPESQQPSGPTPATSVPASKSEPAKEVAPVTVAAEPAKEAPAAAVAAPEPAAPQAQKEVQAPKQPNAPTVEQVQAKAPVSETTAAAAPTPVPVKESKPAAAVPAEAQKAAQAPAKSVEELEEEKLAVERQAVEKKLAEQKIAAEQKLEEEKKRAAATAAATQEAAPVAQPQAPPRGKAKGKK